MRPARAEATSPEGAYRVLFPNGQEARAFENVVDAIVFMRKQCPGQSRVVRGGHVLAVRVSALGGRAAGKTRVKKQKR